MLNTYFLFSAIQFVFVIFLLLLGGMCVGIDFLESIKSSLVLALFDDRISWQGIGYLILAVAVLMLLGLYRLYRRVYLQIQMEKGGVFVDLPIVKEVVEKYLQEASFSEEIEVILRKGNQIEIVISTEKEIESSLEKASVIEEELGSILTSHFGSKHNWLVTFFLKS